MKGLLVSIVIGVLSGIGISSFRRSTIGELFEESIINPLVPIVTLMILAWVLSQYITIRLMGRQRVFRLSIYGLLTFLSQFATVVLFVWITGRNVAQGIFREFLLAAFMAWVVTFTSAAILNHFLKQTTERDSSILDEDLSG